MTSNLSSRKREKRVGRIKAGQPHLSPWEGDGASFSTGTSRHLKDKNRIAEPIGEEKASDTVYLHFSKVVDIASQRLLVVRMVLCGCN